MATYTTPPTATAGQPLSASDWNTKVRDSMEFLHNPPACRARKTTAQSLNTATLTTVLFDAERFDTDAIHDNVTNTSRLTCQTAGIYVITADLSFASNATG